MEKSKILLLASLALGFVSSYLSGQAQTEQIKEEVQKALEGPTED